MTAPDLPPAKSILVVDDEATIRDVIRRYLERDGYAVRADETLLDGVIRLGGVGRDMACQPEEHLGVRRDQRPERVEVTVLRRPHQVLFGSRHRRDDTAAPAVSPRRRTSPPPRSSERTPRTR